MVDVIKSAPILLGVFSVTALMVIYFMRIASHVMVCNMHVPILVDS